MDSKNIRKACDLCYRKRIKCDAQRPRCSNCQVYSCECTHEAASRQRRRKKKKSQAPTNFQGQEQGHEQGQELVQVDQPGTCDLQQQIGLVRPLQQNVEQATDASLWAEKPSLTLPPPVTDQQDPILSSPLLSPRSSQPLMELPSEDIVRHVIDVYLATFNSILPLFHPHSLYRTVDEWFREPSEQKQPSSWAAINIALALGQCHSPGNLSPAVAQAMTVAKCLENAQSVLSDVLAGDIDLQNVQILLGLGILFLGAKPYDIRPPMIFVSTAMRFAQAMGMNRRDYYEGTAPLEAIQRRRVFWIAYILDKDVAARTRQAPIQHDTDMDLDLPPDEATVAAGLNDDDAGFIDAGGRGSQEDDGVGAIIRFNMFRARVELAQIQGRVYDSAFSVRASRMEPGESARLAQSIRLSIQQWKARLPAALSVKVLSSQSDNGLPYLPAAVCYMHSLIIMCLGQLCRVNSMDFHWIDNVLSYARGAGDRKATSSSSAPSLPSFSSSIPPPPQPQGWNVLVGECREFMQLFQSIHSKHPTFVNIQLCPYASGLLCLSVNTFLNFEDRDRLTDQHLMEEAAGILGQVKEQTQCKAVIKVLEVYVELDWHLILLTTGLVT